jgi:trans-2-enoyl-CoA reductase
MASRRPILSVSRRARVHPSHHQPPNAPQIRHKSVFGYEQAKALVFDAPGAPADVLRLHTHSIPPAYRALVNVRFLAAPVNPADINQIQGSYPSKADFTTALGTPSPCAVGGNEGVAEVVGAGEGVTTLRKGDWVIMRRPAVGTWRTHAQVREEDLLRIERHAGNTLAQVATVSVNPCTAYQMLRGFADLKEGDWIVQNGANSAVGRAAIQLARLWGIRTVNVVRAREGGIADLAAELRALGADAVLCEDELLARPGAFREAVRAAAGGADVRLGLNLVGGRSGSALVRCLGEGGRLVTYGGMSRRPVEVGAGDLIFRDVRLHGFWVSRWGERNPREREAAVKHLLELYREGKLALGPLEEVRWDWGTPKETLVGAVSGTLEGFRKGKGIFMFEDT